MCQGIRAIGGAGTPPAVALRCALPQSVRAGCAGLRSVSLGCACPLLRLRLRPGCACLRSPGLPCSPPCSLRALCALCSTLGGVPAPCAYRATPLPFWVVFAPSPKQYGNLRAKNKNQKSNKKFTKPLPSPTILRKKKQKKSKNQKRHQVGGRGESDRATPKKTQQTKWARGAQHTKQMYTQWERYHSRASGDVGYTGG